MLDPQYLWLFGLLIGLGAFTQGFTGIGFGIIVLAGIAFTPWDFERATVVLNLLLCWCSMTVSSTPAAETARLIGQLSAIFCWERSSAYLWGTGLSWLLATSLFLAGLLNILKGLQ